mgnify:CR=1 FL=1
MKEDFPNTLLSEHSVLPDEQVILSRLQTMLRAESKTDRQDDLSTVPASTDSASAPQSDIIEETQDEPEEMEVEDSSS